ncbi:MAG: 50S ribosomal protein L14e [Candidatus Diapherotrites archaeon]|uniref:50S ribosomal protein L14e n=1 Tax=Candidatus Iainarchaeum sp. TaxID=3101447 RepID=A0A7J4JYE4_9ARCH|nr:50S ribosomal protein L14e [Candidatus Diapherotrites archaeon]HIH21265.1 50S ribosomal protein L14e [Candidatus Diapherotrites archaeon]
MALIEIGRVCVKRAGKNAGEKVIVVDFGEKGMPIIEGERVKRKKCNPSHLFPTAFKAELKKGAAREEVIKALKEGI